MEAMLYPTKDNDGKVVGAKKHSELVTLHHLEYFDEKMGRSKKTTNSTLNSFLRELFKPVRIHR